MHEFEGSPGSQPVYIYCNDMPSEHLIAYYKKVD